MRHLLGLLLFVLAVPAHGVEGLATRDSPNSVEQTYRQLIEAAEASGLTIMLELDHADNARSADVDLPPTRVVLFGNPKIGSQLMRCAQTVGIDLPQRMLVWQDRSGQVKVGYNAPKYLVKRHKLSGCKEEIDKVTAVLERLTNAAVADQ
jgi:uncharacterized protein (DUF302 family)